MDETIGNFLDQVNVIHLNESCFFFLSNKENIRIFPGESIPESPRVQHKRHIPEIMIIVTNGRPDPSHDFDGKIGIWRIFVMATAQGDHGEEEEGGTVRVRLHHRRGVVQGVVHHFACDQEEADMATIEASRSAAGRRDPPHGEIQSRDSQLGGDGAGLVDRAEDAAFAVA
ncbi:unnamed protein product [Scytosiphon promiscuus]